MNAGLHIHRTAMEEIHREELGEKWCFICRKRVGFAYIVTATIEPSYYSPTPSIRCQPQGHYNGDLFPGTERMWEE